MSSTTRGGQLLTAPGPDLSLPSLHHNRGRHRRVGPTSAPVVSGARAWLPRAALRITARALRSTESATRTLVGCVGRTCPHRLQPMADVVRGAAETCRVSWSCALGLCWVSLIRTIIECLLQNGRGPATLWGSTSASLCPTMRRMQEGRCTTRWVSDTCTP